MNDRLYGRLARAGLLILALSVFVALVMRLGLTRSVVHFAFQLDSALILLIVGAGLAALVWILQGLYSWRAKHLQAALQVQSQSLEDEQRRFIQRLDHELKNPLTAIQIHLDNLSALDSKQKEAVAELRLQADRLSSLTRGLRRLADLETRPLELEQIEVEELMDDVVALVQAPGRIELEVQRVPWAVPPIDGDRELLLLALRNVVANALAYSPAQIRVRVAHSASDLIVEVIDSGRGIEVQDLEHVTEELFRGSNVHDVAGSGLGLAMVERIVERHRGRLDLRSRVGQGTIVSIHLPYDSTQPA
jgi:two-component system OmpR family sensor kinase